jgi:hypothetical protein
LGDAQPYNPLTGATASVSGTFEKDVREIVWDSTECAAGQGPRTIRNGVPRCTGSVVAAPIT